MKDHFHKHSQFELFPGSVNPSVEKGHSRVFSRVLTVSIENLFVLAVFLIMGLVVAFSLGVERGKRFAQHKSPAVSQSIKRKRVVQDRKPYAQDQTRGQQRSVEPPAPAIRHATLSDKPEIRTASLVPVKIIRTEPKKKLDISPEKLYTVQVASFKQEKYAQKEADSLRDKGYEIFVLPKGKYSIVCVGKFAQKQEARSVSQLLRKRYKDCLIRSL